VQECGGDVAEDRTPWHPTGEGAAPVDQLRIDTWCKPGAVIRPEKGGVPELAPRHPVSVRVANGKGPGKRGGQRSSKIHGPRMPPVTAAQIVRLRNVENSSAGGRCAGTNRSVRKGRSPGVGMTLWDRSGVGVTLWDRSATGTTLWDRSRAGAHARAGGDALPRHTFIRMPGHESTSRLAIDRYGRVAHLRWERPFGTDRQRE
jgi:hypothetical protein